MTMLGFTIEILEEYFLEYFLLFFAETIPIFCPLIYMMYDCVYFVSNYFIPKEENWAKLQ